MSELWAKQWAEEGYLVVRGLFDAERAGRLRRTAERILAQWRRSNPQTTHSSSPTAYSMRHLNHSAYFGDQPAARAEFAELMHAVADEKVLEVVTALFDEEPLFRCTSHFFNPQEGRQDGHWHRDTQFGIADEKEERRNILQTAPTGNAVQMQVALARSDDVEFVPRSHLRWDTAAEYAIRLADDKAHNQSNEMPGAVRVDLAPGDAAIFNPKGLHRGRYHSDKTRRTLMLTYTKASAPITDYFSDQPWFLEPGYLDGLHAPARAFFEKFIHMYRADWEKALVQTA